jgi:hypothetical protein
LNTIIKSKNLVLKLVNSFWLRLIDTMISEGEEKSTTTSASDTQMDDDKATAKYTTRHGSHLTKTSEGVAESEDVEGKKT